MDLVRIGVFGKKDKEWNFLISISVLIIDHMKIAIIGAGISGLSIGQLLKDTHNVTVFESESRPGGLIKCDKVQGNLFHRTGGHVFNTKRQDVMVWFWHFFDCF